jgi:hypothetical protein
MSLKKSFSFSTMLRESYGLKEAGLLTYSYPKDKSKLMMSKVQYLTTERKRKTLKKNRTLIEM